MSAPVSTPEGALQAGFPPTVELVRHVLDFLKWRFSTLPAGCYRWDPDSGDAPDQGSSEIFLGSDTPIDAERVGQRPAITVLRGPAAFQGTGIGDQSFINWRTGSVSRMDVIPTHLIINVLSRVPLEAEKLAWFATTQIWTYRHEIIKSAPRKVILYMGQRPSISPPSPAGSLVSTSTDFDWCVVGCAFPTYLQDSYTTHPLNKQVLNGIHFRGTVQPLPTTGQNEAESLVPLVVETDIKATTP